MALGGDSIDIPALDGLNWWETVIVDDTVSLSTSCAFRNSVIVLSSASKLFFFFR